MEAQGLRGLPCAAVAVGEGGLRECDNFPWDRSFVSSWSYSKFRYVVKVDIICAMHCHELPSSLVIMQAFK